MSTYAAAVQPVSAQTTITTGTEGLQAADTHIPAKDGPMAAYVARPAQAPGKLPTVLVVQEIFGVHEHIKDVARRLAKAGYLAIAPDLYARQGDVSKLTNIEDIRAIVSRVPDAQVMDDLDSAARWAAGHGGDPARLGVTGFCWGGRIVWLYAAHNPDLRAGVAWYGKLEGVIERARDIRAPVLGLYGGADAGIPNESVDRMREALRAAGKPSEIHTNPDMPHGFHADYRPSYRKAAAEDGWQRMLGWFRRHAVA